ncbi:MAG: DUF4142 domain-containing protein [Verrucomicrobiota bacterium]|nr:DUF4142 domain-containing protein [Verrucomicrobiota bacterium]
MKHQILKTAVCLSACAAFVVSAGIIRAATEPAKATDKSMSLSSADKSFMKAAAKGGMMEVEMGQMAAKDATSADVKKFGERMVTDHGKANEELKALAAKKGVELPAAPSVSKWKSDKDYVDMMVKDHEKDLAEFDKEAKSASDADVKAFAKKTSAVIRKHLALIQDIQKKMK